MKSVKSRTLIRSFKLEICGPHPLEQIVMDVLSKLERTKIRVYKPNDDRIFGPREDGDRQSEVMRE